MGNDSQFPQGNQSPNQVTLPPWRLDNIYTYIWSLIVMVIGITASTVTIYYNVIRTIDKQAADTTLIKQDVAYIKEAITENGTVS